MFLQRQISRGVKEDLSGHSLNLKWLDLYKGTKFICYYVQWEGNGGIAGNINEARVFKNKGKYYIFIFCTHEYSLRKWYIRNFRVAKKICKQSQKIKWKQISDIFAKQGTNFLDIQKTLSIKKKVYFLFDKENYTITSIQSIHLKCAPLLEFYDGIKTENKMVKNSTLYKEKLVTNWHIHYWKLVY